MECGPVQTAACTSTPSSSCADSYFNTHLTVVNVATGNAWTLGTGLQRCHLLSAPAWTPDSTSLVVAYGAANTSTNTPLGVCSPWDPARLLVVNALHKQDGLAGASVPPDPSCEFSAVTATATGPVALEHCNASSSDSNGEYIDGPARLVLFNATLHAESRVPLGECNDGGELASDHTGSGFLVTAYLYCPGTTSPVTKLWRDTSLGLTPLDQVPGDGDPLTKITW